MLHKDVMQKFEEISNVDERSINTWFPNGKNSVRIRFKNNTEIVFTYASPKVWRIETIDHFIKNLTKGVN